MNRCAFISCDNLEGFVVDDELAAPALRDLGWEVHTQPWRSDCDWGQYDLAIIRSTWDYTHHLNEFLQHLENINNSTLLLNSFELVKWNTQKTYIKDLVCWGAPCIPTLFEWPASWDELFSLWNTSKIMLKPQVAANSEDTHIITPHNKPEKPLFEQAPMIQPFRENVVIEGEISFHFFASEFSHAVLKIPKKSDYRVQEEHGGQILSHTPAPEDLNVALKIQKILDKKLPKSLYSRIDLVRSPKGQLELMEVELIEPALYFRTDPQSAARFAQACKKFVSN